MDWKQKLTSVVLGIAIGLPYSAAAQDKKPIKERPEGEGVQYKRPTGEGLEGAMLRNEYHKGSIEYDLPPSEMFHFNYDGVLYTVNKTRFAESGKVYNLKGDQLVIASRGKKILAHRYFRDPRVVVAGASKKEAKDRESRKATIDAETRTHLVSLLRQLYPEIEEVVFPDERRVKTR